MKYTVNEHGRLDYLVNNGGGQFMSPLSDMSTKGWNAVIDTNLNGTYYCFKHGKSASFSPYPSCIADPLPNIHHNHNITS